MRDARAAGCYGRRSARWVAVSPGYLGSVSAWSYVRMIDGR